MTEVEVEVEAEELEEEAEETEETFTLTVTYGDVTLLQMKEGALVNPSNTGLILGSGVSEQIARRAGPMFQQQLHTARTALYNNRLDLGRVLATDPGQLFFKKIIHVSLIGKRKVDARLLTTAIINCFDKAEELGVSEIVIPALGVGIGKYPLDGFIKLFWQICSEELVRSESLRHVVLCLFDEDEFAVAEKYALENQDGLPENMNLEISRGSSWAG